MVKKIHVCSEENRSLVDCLLRREELWGKHFARNNSTQGKQLNGTFQCLEECLENKASVVIKRIGKVPSRNGDLLITYEESAV